MWVSVYENARRKILKSHEVDNVDDDHNQDNQKTCVFNKCIFLDFSVARNNIFTPHNL